MHLNVCVLFHSLGLKLQFARNCDSLQLIDCEENEQKPFEELATFLLRIRKMVMSMSFVKFWFWMNFLLGKMNIPKFDILQMYKYF